MSHTQSRSIGPSAWLTSHHTCVRACKRELHVCVCVCVQSGTTSEVAGGGGPGPGATAALLCVRVIGSVLHKRA